MVSFWNGWLVVSTVVLSMGRRVALSAEPGDVVDLGNTNVEKSTIRLADTARRREGKVRRNLDSAVTFELDAVCEAFLA